MFIKKALQDGVILSFVLCSWITLILKINPRFEMKSYPSEIVKCVNPQTKQEKTGFLFMAIPMSVVVIIYLVFSTSNIYKNCNVSYWILLLHLFAVFTIWNLFDLFILDWLIFCRVTPGFMILPGTEGNIAYKDYFYHFKSFLKGIILSAFGAIILSGVVYIII